MVKAWNQGDCRFGGCKAPAAASALCQQHEIAAGTRIAGLRGAHLQALGAHAVLREAPQHGPDQLRREREGAALERRRRDLLVHEPHYRDATCARGRGGAGPC